MPKVLFDLRNSDASRFDTLNDQPRTSQPGYLVQFGQVGSPEWWRNYDAGLICKDEKVGVVIHLDWFPKRLSETPPLWDLVFPGKYSTTFLKTGLGTHKKWGEDPAVVIQTDRCDNAYDLTGVLARLECADWCLDSCPAIQNCHSVPHRCLHLNHGCTH